MVQRSKHSAAAAFDPTPQGFSANRELISSLTDRSSAAFPIVNFDFDALLSVLLRTPKTTGAALAKVHGEFLVCVASKGANAPVVGTRCHRTAGLTGRCFSSGKIQLSNETNSDRRIDFAACSELGVRSVLAIPLLSASNSLGVLEVLSSEPNAFNWRTIRPLVRIAQTIEIGVPGPPVSDIRNDDSEVAHDCAFRRGCNSNYHGLQQVLEAVSSIQDLRGFGSPEPAFAESYLIHQNAAKPPLADEPTSKPIDPPNFEIVGEELSNRHWAVPATIVSAILLAFFLLSYSKMLHSRFSDGRGTFRQQTTNALPGSVVQASTTTPQVRSNMPKPSFAAATPAAAAEAVRMPSNSAVRNNDSELFNLGIRYLNGIGTDKDEALGANWIKKAANLGNNQAQNRLSTLYAKGIGVPRDPVRAYTWAVIAARSSGVGYDEVAALRQTMTPLQVDDAEHRIQHWFSQKVPK